MNKAAYAAVSQYLNEFSHTYIMPGVNVAEAAPNVRLIAAEHNCDAAFINEFSRWEKTSNLHDTWVSHGSPEDPGWELYDIALQNMGVYETGWKDPQASKHLQMWSVARCPPECWEKLKQINEMIQSQSVKGVRVAAASRVQKRKVAQEAYVDTAGGTAHKSPTGKGGKKKKKVPKMPNAAYGGEGENEKSAQASKVDIPDVPWLLITEFLLMSENNGVADLIDPEGNSYPATLSPYHYKCHLFDCIIKREQSIEEAAANAKSWKALAQVTQDFVGQAKCVDWAECRRRFPAYTSDEKLDMIKHQYMSKGQKNTHSSILRRNVSPLLLSTVAGALEHERRLQLSEATAEDSRFTFLELKRDGQLSQAEINKGVKSSMKYLVVEADVTKMLEEDKVPKLPYRLVFIDVPYETPKNHGMSPEEYKKVCIMCDALSSNECLSVVCFPGAQNCTAFMEIAKPYFPHQEKLYWFKSGVHCSGLNRHVNQIEECFISMRCQIQGYAERQTFPPKSFFN